MSDQRSSREDSPIGRCLIYSNSFHQRIQHMCCPPIWSTKSLRKADPRILRRYCSAKCIHCSKNCKQFQLRLYSWHQQQYIVYCCRNNYQWHSSDKQIQPIWSNMGLNWVLLQLIHIFYFHFEYCIQRNRKYSLQWKNHRSSKKDQRQYRLYWDQKWLLLNIQCKYYLFRILHSLGLLGSLDFLCIGYSSSKSIHHSRKCRQSGQSQSFYSLDLPVDNFPADQRNTQKNILHIFRWISLLDCSLARLFEFC